MTTVNQKSARLVGLDVARALALFGMIIVNFKIVFGAEGSAWLKAVTGILEGKAAAVFVVLAGVGLALITRRAHIANDRAKLKKAKGRILKRAIALFLLGISYITIWPADILHFYGIYMLLVLLLVDRSDWHILAVGIALIVVYPVLMLLWTYETGWDLETLSYTDLWTPSGFARNLFYNGFHPVLPWAAFMLFGYWLGRQDLQNTAYVKRLFTRSVLAFVFLQLLSYSLIGLLSEGDEQVTKELRELLGTSPMPPLPFYMLSGITIAFATISACILLTKKWSGAKITEALAKTGQLALTFYVAHVLLGMGLMDTLYPNQLGQFTITFSAGYAVLFSLLCVGFAQVWLKHKTQGPVEWVFRKITT